MCFHLAPKIHSIAVEIYFAVMHFLTFTPASRYGDTHRDCCTHPQGSDGRQIRRRDQSEYGYFSKSGLV